MKLRRIIRHVLAGLSAVLILAGTIFSIVWWYFHPHYIRIEKITYAQRKGRDLQFDVIQPDHPNGAGVVVMVSGRWKSSGSGMDPLILAPLLRRGYTLFTVAHGSQPEFTVMEIFADVQRAVRHVRHTAREHGVDPQRLGVTGGSSGGHLSLMLATRGDSGNPSASDLIERESSELQAAAVFYPVTDLLNLGRSTENPGDGGPPKSFVKAFGPDSTNMPAWKIIGRDMSPIYHVSTNLPPVFILHGDADTLVPIEQSEWFVERARAAGRTIQLINRPGKKHGWLMMLWDTRLFADWFDRHMPPKSSMDPGFKSN